MTDINMADVQYATTEEAVSGVEYKSALPAQFALGGVAPKEGDGIFIQLMNGNFVIGLYVTHNFGYIVLDKPLMPIISQGPQGSTLELVPYGVPFLSMGVERRTFPLTGIMQGEYCHDKRLLSAVANFNYNPGSPKIHRAPASALDALNAAARKQGGG